MNAIQLKPNSWYWSKKLSQYVQFIEIKRSGNFARMAYVEWQTEDYKSAGWYLTPADLQTIENMGSDNLNDQSIKRQFVQITRYLQKLFADLSH